MSYIEETSFFTGPFMAFGKTQIGILDWHGIAGERNHLAAIGNMKVIETGVIEGFFV